MRAARLRVGFLAAPAAILALFYAYPLARVLSSATPEAFAWLATDYVRSRLALAALQAILSVALTLAIALPLAWIHHRYAIRGGAALLAIHMAPFVLPVFVVVYGIQLTIGAWLPPLAAVVVAHAYYNYGFAARVVHATLERRPRRLEDAATTLGATPRTAFLRVTLPLLLPSLAGVALLVFLFTFASFGTVLFLGGGEVSTPETMMYAQLGGAFPREDRAAALGAAQLLFSIALFWGYLSLARRERGLERAPDRAAPRAGRAVQALALASVAVALAPILAVLAGGFRIGGEWSLEAWRALADPTHPAHLSSFRLERALGLSLLYAACATALALALTALLAYALPALGERAKRAVQALASLPLGTSSLLLGLGYLLAFGAGAFLDLRGSIAAIVLLHTLLAFPFAARILLPAFAQRDARLDEAAALLGASPLQVARRVHLPLLAAPLAAAAGLAAAVSLGDFGASVLVTRPDNMPLSVWIGAHDVAFNPLLKAQAIALAGILAALSGLVYVAVQKKVTW